MIYLRRKGKHGQALLELALLLPVILLILVVAADFGRAFAVQITLNNAVRVGANFASQNPDGWSGGGNATTQSRYQALVTNEWDGVQCGVPDSVPAPNFSGTSIGSPVAVSVSCNYQPLTPIFGDMIGTVTISAAAEFPVRSGAITGTSGGSALCNVPNLVGTNTSAAQAAWTSAGFLTFVAYDPPLPPDYTIVTQSAVAGSSHWCDNTFVTVSAPTCEVPNMVGRDTSEVAAAWLFAGFASTPEFDPPRPPDYEVWAQYPEADLTLACTGPSLLIEGDVPPCEVPDFVGLSSSSAQERWTDAGFRTTVGFDPAGPLPYDVDGQSVASGHLGSCTGTTITLTGTPTCTVPNMINEQPAAALSMWADAGFTGQNLIWNPQRHGNARIRSQSPGGGTSGSCVDLRVTVSQ